MNSDDQRFCSQSLWVSKDKHGVCSPGDTVSLEPLDPRCLSLGNNLQPDAAIPSMVDNSGMPGNREQGEEVNNEHF